MVDSFFLYRTLMSDNIVALATCPQGVKQVHKHAISADSTADHGLLVIQFAEEVHMDTRSFMRAKKMQSRLVSMRAVAVTPHISFCCL